MNRCFPDQVAALKGELDSYLIAQTHQALEASTELQAQGLPKESAEELARADLLVKPPKEDYRPKKWEIEGRPRTWRRRGSSC
jgi:hypothetical protein